MSIKDDRGIEHIVKRWIDIFALSLVVFLLYLAIEPPIGKLGNWVEDSVLKKGGVVNILVIFFGLAAIWIPLWRLGATQFGLWHNFSIKTFLKWPPVWLSVIFSICCLSLLPNYTFVEITIISGIFLAGLPIGFIIRMVNQWLTEDKKNDQQQSQATESFHEISTKPEKVIKWLGKEEAITEPGRDLFDMAVQSRNISRLLLATPLKTVALVGEYGSGKSSILKMVDYYLKPENRNKLTQNNGNDKSDSVNQEVNVITCTVAGWGFAKGSTAEHILECTINELSKHVDVSDLRIVPEQYVAAMGSANNVFLKIIAALATCWKSPLDILKRIDNVLIAIDKRLIIFLEDVDRNNIDEVFFNEIASLLDTLRQLKKVSFVFAIGQEYRAEEVLIKTAEHVENVPRLNCFDVLKTLESFRTYCIALCPVITSKIPKEFKRDRIGWDRSEMIQAVAGIYDDSSKPIDAIVELTSNPRVLKHALRRTLTGWEKLAGEIDFNDLLIVNVLKVVDERIFSFIDKHIARLCALATDNKKESQDELRKKLEPEYTRATEKADYDFNAVSKLVDALFPRFIGGSMTDELLRRDLTSYQHVANDEPTKYWERIKRGELYDKEIADREILFSLDEWNKDWQCKVFRDKNMREAILSAEEVFDKVRQFKEFIGAETLRALAQEQFQLTLEKEKNKASHENCPAVGQWWLLKPTDLDESCVKWLGEEICKAIPVSLRYANDLYHFWLEPKRNPQPKLRAKIIEEAKQIYGSNPEALVRAIDPECYSVRHFARQYSEKEQGGPGFNPEEWQWLGDALIAGAKMNRDVIVPQIVLLVGHIDIRPAKVTGKEYSYELSIDLAKGLFGKKIKQFMELIAKGIDLSNYDSEVRTYIELAQNCAKNWLADQGDGVV